jgi:hypothetical protein
VLQLPAAPRMAQEAGGHKRFALRGSVVGGIEMTAEPKRKSHQDDSARDKRERRHQENALDEALKDTFPASDPVSFEQPAPPATDRDRAKT